MQLADTYSFEGVVLSSTFLLKTSVILVFFQLFGNSSVFGIRCSVLIASGFTTLTPLNFRTFFEI